MAKSIQATPPKISGTAAERATLDTQTLSELTEFNETDTGDTYQWRTTVWYQLQKEGACNVFVNGGGLQGPEGQSGNGQAVTIGASSTQSSAITGTAIDIVGSQDGYVAIGSSPTAVANTDYRIISGITYRFPITTGNIVAVIQDTTAGTLYIHPVQ